MIIGQGAKTASPRARVAMSTMGHRLKFNSQPSPVIQRSRRRTFFIVSTVGLALGAGSPDVSGRLLAPEANVAGQQASIPRRFVPEFRDAHVKHSERRDFAWCPHKVRVAGNPGCPRIGQSGLLRANHCDPSLWAQEMNTSATEFPSCTPASLSMG